MNHSYRLLPAIRHFLHAESPHIRSVHFSCGYTAKGNCQVLSGPRITPRDDRQPQLLGQGDHLVALEA